MPATQIIKLRRGTAAAWTGANPTLAAGEPGYETDTGKIKIGDGSTAWNSLAYRFTNAVTFGTPAIVLGSSAAAGSIDEPIRRDATIAAFDTTVPSTQAFGDAAAIGTAAFAARRDHKHAMPATPVTTINKTGATALTGAVTLTGGTNVTLTQSGQDISIAASGGGGTTIGRSQLVYRYTVAGSDKASIDTGVDTPDAGDNDWTGGDLLEIWFLGRTDQSAAAVNVSLTLNNTGGTSYDQQFLDAANTSVGGGTGLGGAKFDIPIFGSTAAASYPGMVGLAIPGYADTTFFKVLTALAVRNSTTAGQNLFEGDAFTFRSTAAITRLKIDATSTFKFKVGSKLLIYKRLAS